MNTQFTKENLDSLKTLVLNKRPVLKQILKKKGEKKLLTYANEYVDVNLNPTIPKRQRELLSVLKEVASKRFGESVGCDVEEQLKKYYFVSTADHTGPINHPFFVNSNLLIAAATKNHSDVVLKNIIILSCANISVDNSSFPRGLFFQNFQNNKLLTHRLPFFSSNARPPSIYTLKPYQKENINEIYKILETKLSKKEISEDEYKKIMLIFSEIYDRPEILALPSYAEQISLTNFVLWKKMFNKSKITMPNLIYLEIEDIVSKLIINYHLNQDTIINHILFDHEYEHYINTYFENIFGSFSRKESKGTYLFWALPKGARHNLQLWKEGKYLVSKDRSYKIELRPETIKAALESKELIPGLLLDFIVVSFYYGLKCLGGFNQVNYLTMMKNSYIKMNVDLENYRSIEICARAQTKEICDGPTIAFMKYGENKKILASGLDLILNQNEDSWSILIKTIKDVSLEEAIDPLLPEIYKISYENKNLDPKLASITDRDIMEIAGLDNKITPCVTMA